MQATNGCYTLQNGDETSASSTVADKAATVASATTVNKSIIGSRTEQDIIRLIGQHLRGLGLK